MSLSRWFSRQSTPLLLAATSGALDAVQCLVALDANVAYKDELGNTVIHLAASNIHTNVIEYFIRLNHRHVPTWRILVDLIYHPDVAMKRATVQCLHAMTTHGEEFWHPLLETGRVNLIDAKRSNARLSFFNTADGIKRLIVSLKSTDNGLLLSTLSVLCNISTNAEVRRAISNVNENLSEMFSNLLKSTNDEIRSKTAILIADICFIPSNQVTTLSMRRAISPLDIFVDRSRKISGIQRRSLVSRGCSSRRSKMF